MQGSIQTFTFAKLLQPFQHYGQRHWHSLNRDVCSENVSVVVHELLTSAILGDVKNDLCWLMQHEENL